MVNFHISQRKFVIFLICGSTAVAVIVVQYMVTVFGTRKIANYSYLDSLRSCHVSFLVGDQLMFQLASIIRCHRSVTEQWFSFFRFLEHWQLTRHYLPLAIRFIDYPFIRLLDENQISQSGHCSINHSVMSLTLF
jgi:hypothetical protein